MKTILLVCGEPSGADYVNDILRAARSRCPNARMVAVGDSDNPVDGVEYLFHYRIFARFGVVAVLLRWWLMVRAGKRIVAWCRKNKPDLAVLVDSPGLNLRLAKEIRPWCANLWYFISPHFWAWNYRRIHSLRGMIDTMYPVLPFEMDIYRRERIPAVLVQHPKVAGLMKQMRTESRKEKVFSGHDGDVLGLLPGSRKAEIDRFIPLLVQTALLLLDRNCRLRFVMPVRAGALSASQRRTLKKELGQTLVVVEDDFYTAVGNCDFCLCASGTASLEVALLRVPMVVFYKLGFIDTLLYRLLVSTKYVSLVNLLFDRRVVPECLGGAANPEVLSAETETLLQRRGAWQNQIDQFDRLQNMLQRKNTMGDKVADFALGLAGAGDEASLSDPGSSSSDQTRTQQRQA